MILKITFRVLLCSMTYDQENKIFQSRLCFLMKQYLFRTKCINKGFWCWIQSFNIFTFIYCSHEGLDPCAMKLHIFLRMHLIFFFLSAALSTRSVGTRKQTTPYTTIIWCKFLLFPHFYQKTKIFIPFFFFFYFHFQFIFFSLFPKPGKNWE